MTTRSSEDYTPIEWPSWWRGKGRHFLEGMPVIGPHCKVIEHVRNCLRRRNQSLFDEAWSKYGYSISECRSVSDRIGAIVKTYVEWPNYHFLPEDRTALILGVIPGVWYDAEDPVEEVRSAFDLKEVKEGDFRFYDIVLEGKFKNLVGMIVGP